MRGWKRALINGLFQDRHDGRFHGQKGPDVRKRQSCAARVVKPLHNVHMELFAAESTRVLDRGLSNSSRTFTSLYAVVVLEVENASELGVSVIDTRLRIVRDKANVWLFSDFLVTPPVREGTMCPPLDHQEHLQREVDSP